EINTRMASKLLFQRNLFECYLCGSIVSKPKALPCLHTFCTECLNVYIPSKATETGISFPCPQCLRNIKPKDTSKPIKEWAALFPDNIFLINLLNNSKVKSFLDNANEKDLRKKKNIFYNVSTLNYSLPWKTTKSPDIYSIHPSRCQYFTRSLAYYTRSVKTIRENTSYLKRYFHFQSKRNYDICYSKIFFSQLKPLLDVRISAIHSRNSLINNEPEVLQIEANVNQNSKYEICDANKGKSKSNTEKKQSEFNIELEEEFSCNIPGLEIRSEPSNILVTSDGYIIVADSKNCNIKKFSLKGKLIDLLLLHSSPSDITLISTTQIAISFHISFDLCFLTLNKPFTITGRLSLPKQYQKVSCGVDQTMAGLSINPGGQATLDVFSFTGEIMSSVSVQVRGENAYLTTSLEGDMFLSQCKDRILSRYDSKGNQKFLYPNTDQTEFIDPKGLCVDPDGFIYLVDGKASKIHRLNLDCTYDCEILTTLDGIDRPAVVCIDKPNHRLIVALSNGTIQIFILHPTNGESKTTE
ncbi:tripartite motif-containing protein 45-like, partial [Argonauta hians]